MKIIITGSLGHIGQPLTQILVAKGHQVTVISSSADKKRKIEELGATAAIGSLEDGVFLSTTFSGADAVYLMTPPNYYFDPSLDPIEFSRGIALKYAAAVKAAKVKRIIQLSSFGGELESGTGFILAAHHVERILDQLDEVAITVMRPTSFYYNLLNFVGMIKHTGKITANYGADDKLLLVAPKDIAAAIADEFELPAEHRKIRYVNSDELTGNEVADILGSAIDMPDLKWELISDQESLDQQKAAGVPGKMAEGLVELYACHHSGRLAAGYYQHPPAQLGKTKLQEFAPEFAKVYNQQ